MFNRVRFTFTFLLAVCCFPQLTHAIELIRPSESALPDAPPHFAARGVVRGPGLQLVSPDVSLPLSGPFDLKVRFEPRGGSRIDTSSVKVAYIKSPLVDLTERIRPGITETGLTVTGTEVPPGDHLIRFTVKDLNGRESNLLVNLTVNR